ncbi:histidinol-phosphatase [Treponema sp.]
MRYSCLHTHTDFCDGATDLDSMCRAAYERGLVSIGFSSHAPLPLSFAPPSPWHLLSERLDEYAGAVREAKARWAGKIDVYLGLEIDYIRGFCGPKDGRFVHLNLDYIIGSVHYLVPANSYTPFTVDGPEEEWLDGIQKGFAGDGEAAVAAYWTAVTEMVTEGGFDIVGHLDLVKKNNKLHSYDEAGIENRKGGLGAVKAIAKRDIITEVNTGGLNRKKIDEVYPAPWLLKAMHENGIRTTINADAHEPEHLDGYYELAKKELIGAGYTETMLFGGKDSKGKASWSAEALQ